MTTKIISFINFHFDSWEKDSNSFRAKFSCSENGTIESTPMSRILEEWFKLLQTLKMKFEPDILSDSTEFQWQYSIFFNSIKFGSTHFVYVASVTLTKYFKVFLSLQSRATRRNLSKKKLLFKAWFRAHVSE